MERNKSKAPAKQKHAIMNDNWYVHASPENKEHVAEVEQLKAQLETERAMRVEFEEWLESRYERLCGVISRGGDLSDESEFESCSLAVAMWHELKAKHLQNKSTPE